MERSSDLASHCAALVWRVQGVHFFSCPNSGKMVIARHSSAPQL